MEEILLLSLAAGMLPRGGGGIRSHKCPLAERSPESPKQRQTVSVATGTIPGREVELRIAHVVPGEDREAPGRGSQEEGSSALGALDNFRWIYK